MVDSAKKPLSKVARGTLESLGWLSTQPQTFRDAVLAQAQSYEIEPGDIVYRLDDPPGGLYAVCDGFIDVVVAARSGTSRLVHVARSGWWAGDAALISDTPRRGELTARAKATIAYVSKERMLHLCTQDPENWRRVAVLTVSMFDHALSIMNSQWSESPDSLVRSALLRLVGVGQLHGRGGESDPVTFPINQWEIAELAGLSRNAAGPVLRRLQDEGSIEIGYRRLTVRDRSLL